jgi:hypothetical protein
VTSASVTRRRTAVAGAERRSRHGEPAVLNPRVLIDGPGLQTHQVAGVQAAVGRRETEQRLPQAALAENAQREHFEALEETERFVSAKSQFGAGGHFGETPGGLLHDAPLRSDPVGQVAERLLVRADVSSRSAKKRPVPDRA